MADPGAETAEDGREPSIMDGESPEADSAATAPPGAPGDEEDEREDPAGDEVTDPAAEAAYWRADAAGLRAERDRVVADSQARIGDIAAKADAEARRLEAEAAEADKQAETWSATAAREAAIVQSEAEVATLTGARDALTAEADQLDREAADLTGKLGEFAAARAEAEQRRAAAATRMDDITAAVEGVKAATADLAAIAEAERHPQQLLAGVQARLDAIRRPMQRGPDGTERGGELAGITAALDRASARLTDLRRQAEGKPPLAEAEALLKVFAPPIIAGLMARDPTQARHALLSNLPEGPARDEMERVLTGLPAAESHSIVTGASTLAGMKALARWLDLLAVQAPDFYRTLRKGCLDAAVPLPAARVPTLREELAKPRFEVTGDGTMRYTGPYEGWDRAGHVSAPLPGSAGGLLP